MVQAALPVRERRRDSVDHHPNPSKPKLRTGSEPTNRHALPNGRIEPVLDLDAGKPSEGLLEEETTPTPLEIVFRQRRYRERSRVL